ncbi:unnamed protein product [Clavelina lepadiformis]|uniref:Uncharacterized protein n=1 Tax=Clavelina lepadiformis TaxID=159417 RepID=A0ABP0GAT2_CLALP
MPVQLREKFNYQLKHVLGLSLISGRAFSCDQNTGLVAYPAGCVIVLYDVRVNERFYVSSPGEKPITCLRFSPDGKFIATGESGKNPLVRLFSLIDRRQVAEFGEHEEEVSCVGFTPNGNYIISAGNEFDFKLIVWDRKNENLFTSNRDKVANGIKAMTFAKDGSYFVTVGLHHVNFRNLSDMKAKHPLRGHRPSIDLKHSTFCDVVCCNDTGFTFAITRGGFIYQYSRQNRPRISINSARHEVLQCRKGRTVSVLNGVILCGCGCGSIHAYNTSTLQFITEVFPPEELRNIGIIASAVDAQKNWLHCVYSNHSLVTFDLSDVMSPRIYSQSDFHNSHVCDVVVMPSTSKLNSLPKDSFLTCGDNGKVMAWQARNKTVDLNKVINVESHVRQSDIPEGSSVLEHHPMCIRDDGKNLAVGDKTGFVHVFELEAFEHRKTHRIQQTGVLCADYAVNSNMLACGGHNGKVSVNYDEFTRRNFLLRCHSAAVASVKFVQCGEKTILISCGADHGLYFCSLSDVDGELDSREIFRSHRDSLTDIALLEESILVGCASSIHEYSIPGGVWQRSFKTNSCASRVFQLAVDSGKTIVAVACGNHHIYILSLSPGISDSKRCLHDLNSHSASISSLTFDLKDRLISTAGTCVFVWTSTYLEERNEKIEEEPPTNQISEENVPSIPTKDETSEEVDEHPSSSSSIAQPKPLSESQIDLEFKVVMQEPIIQQAQGDDAGEVRRYCLEMVDDIINSLDDVVDDDVVSGPSPGDETSMDMVGDNINSVDDVISGPSPLDEPSELKAAKDQLLHAFDRAVHVYESEVNGGNESDVIEMIGAFRGIYSRIGELKLVSAVEVQTGTNSLDEKLSEDSLVFSLLREYTDKLVDLVHND